MQRQVPQRRHLDGFVRVVRRGPHLNLDVPVCDDAER